MTDLEHVENMRVAQAKIHEGDARWYVITANGGIVRGPMGYERELADQALKQIRARAVEEAAEELEANGLGAAVDFAMRRQPIGRDAA